MVLVDLVAAAAVEDVEAPAATVTPLELAVPPVAPAVVATRGVVVGPDRVAPAGREAGAVSMSWAAPSAW